MPTLPSADFCTLVWGPHYPLSPTIEDMVQTSRGKLDRLPRIAAESTSCVLDGYGLRGPTPARPTQAASYSVFVHRLARLLHASFRPHLAV